MAFKMGGMSFGKGTNYKSPQLMKKESAMKMAKKNSAMDMAKDPMKMKTKMSDRGSEGAKKLKKELEAKRKAKEARGQAAEDAKSALTMKKGSAMDMKKGSAMDMKKGPMKMKKKSPMKKDDYDKALKNDPQLEKYIAKRKTLEKGSAAFGNNQYRINTAYYGKDKADQIRAKYRKKHNLSAGTEKGTEKAVKLSQVRINKLDKVDQKGISQIKKNTQKGEINENFDKKEARAEKKETRRGKGNKKQKAQADLNLEKAKLADLKASRGGRKGQVLNKLRTKRSEKRVSKGKEKVKNA